MQQRAAIYSPLSLSHAHHQQGTSSYSPLPHATTRGGSSPPLHQMGAPPPLLSPWRRFQLPLLPLPSQCNNLVLPLHIETHHWNPVHHATVRSFSFSVLHHEAHIHCPLSVVTPQGYIAELQHFMDATLACLVVFPNQQPHPVGRQPLCCPSSVLDAIELIPGNHEP